MRWLLSGLIGYFLIILAACSSPKTETASVKTETTGSLHLEALEISDLPGWINDDMTGTMTAFRRSCPGLIKAAETFRGSFGIGLPDSWRRVCTAAGRFKGKDAAIRQFFETHFDAYALREDGEDTGLLTGYYEPELRGSRRPTSRYSTPLYRRPDDLVMVNLGKFRSDLGGRRIAGRLRNGRLLPYASRAEINRGALKGRGLELLWVDNPVDAFFLQVQGSGRVRLSDGTISRVSYAGDNGHSYVSIGRRLVQRGVMTAPDVNLESIRRWIAAHPAQARELLEQNPSYVFFEERPAPTGGWSQDSGPPGAANVPLTPGRSLAIDDAIYPYGLPIWIDGIDPLSPGQPLQRLTMTQDTGGALRGALRGDLFWGHGRLAEKRAGHMRDQASYYILLPKSIPFTRSDHLRDLARK